MGRAVRLLVEESEREAAQGGKYVESALENEGIAYVRPPELDEAQQALANGDLTTARKLAGEMLKKAPDVLEAEVLMFRVERRQKLLNAASARLERVLDKALQKEDPVALHGVLSDLGEDFEAKAVRPSTAARLCEQLERASSDTLKRRTVMELLEIASAAQGLVGAGGGSSGDGGGVGESGDAGIGDDGGFPCDVPCNPPCSGADLCCRYTGNCYDPTLACPGSCCSSLGCGN